MRSEYAFPAYFWHAEVDGDRFTGTVEQAPLFLLRQGFFARSQDDANIFQRVAFPGWDGAHSKFIIHALPFWTNSGKVNAGLARGLWHGSTRLDGRPADVTCTQRATGVLRRWGAPVDCQSRC